MGEQIGPVQAKKKNKIKTPRSRRDYQVATDANTSTRFTTAARVLTAAGLGDYRVAPGPESDEKPTVIVNAPIFDTLVAIVREGVQGAQLASGTIQGEQFDTAYEGEVTTIASQMVRERRRLAEEAANPVATTTAPTSE